ncbi:prepilin-type cleavage/methylation domain-containing protein [Paracidovorax sp. MALMAid1276]|uniref:prepilin-type cleavage/methylation domain-containing protein n=1 Tax=Paracidovorax sp. MALMAid1276 TaxID=3411631 RepID=UPI003B9DA482
MKHRMLGFTLVELSLVLLALGLILPGAVIFWQLSERHRVAGVQMDAQQQSRQALVGYLHSHYRLPCPAADTNGVESCTDGTDIRQMGYLPWRTLSLPRPEAGRLRYGVYRAPSGATMAAAPQDRDLAVVRDRMNPLRVRTPDPKPQNHTEAPNPNSPPIPAVLPSLNSVLGMTQSGNDAAPLNPACDAAADPACPLGVVNAVNLIDICLALNTASDDLVAPAGRLATQVGANRRIAAFVVAAPGLLDAQGNGQAFDGANATASNADPTFASPAQAVSDQYDDIVLAASHYELFTELQCGAALSAISHAHFNVATGAFVMERAMYDYRDQLYIAVVLARADVAAAAAGALSAAAGSLDAAKEMVSAVADTTMSVGARAFQIALAAVGIGLAVASDIAAAAAVVDAALSLAEAEDVFDDFATRTTAMTNLSRDINTNALRADAIGH